MNNAAALSMQWKLLQHESENPDHFGGKEPPLPPVSQKKNFSQNLSYLDRITRLYML